MEKNQNDQQNQQADNKSSQPKPGDGTKKETNPNDPQATQIQKSSSEREGSGAIKSDSSSTTKRTEETARENDGTHGASKAGDSDAAPMETIKGGL